MAHDVAMLKVEITSALDFLPPESLRLLREFVTFLRSRAGQPVPHGRIVRLGGLWAGTPEITEEDIAEARREMWGRFGISRGQGVGVPNLLGIQRGEPEQVRDSNASSLVSEREMAEGQEVIYEHLLQQGGDWMLREASAYFAGKGGLHSALRRLTHRLNVEGIPYALLGGLALAEHGYPRLTEDIDLLLATSGLARFRQRLVGRGYRPAFSGARKTFRDTETGVRIEIVTAGEYPGDGLPKPVVFPDPATPEATVEIEGIRVVTLEKLVELKLASGMSAPHRLRDLADVQDLITRLRLPLTLTDRLDPSVRAEYRDLWEKAHMGD